MSHHALLPKYCLRTNQRDQGRKDDLGLFLHRCEGDLPGEGCAVIYICIFGEITTKVCNKDRNVGFSSQGCKAGAGCQ